MAKDKYVQFVQTSPEGVRPTFSTKPPLRKEACKTSLKKQSKRDLK